MATVNFDTTVWVKTLTAASITLPSSTVDNAAVQADADIDATKLMGEYRHTYSDTGTISSTTVYLWIARGAGTLKAFEAALCEVIPSGDKTITLDLQKSTSAGAFATVLNATVVLNSSNVLRTLEAGTIDTTAYVDGDVFKLTVTTGGSTGTDPEGLVVSVTTHESNP